MMANLSYPNLSLCECHLRLKSSRKEMVKNDLQSFARNYGNIQKIRRRKTLIDPIEETRSESCKYLR